jgi:HK97 gp10 family phage protein
MAIKLRSGIRLEGEEQIAKNLKGFITETESAAGNILEEGAEILKKEAQGRAPGPTGRKSGKYPHPPGTLQDSIDIGWVYHGKGKVGIKVGIAENEYFKQEDKFYARFVEFGTKKMLAQPFMRPTLVTSRAKVRKLIIEGLKKELGFE